MSFNAWLTARLGHTLPVCLGVIVTLTIILEWVPLNRLVKDLWNASTIAFDFSMLAFYGVSAINVFLRPTEELR